MNEEVLVDIDFESKAILFTQKWVILIVAYVL